MSTCGCCKASTQELTDAFALYDVDGTGRISKSNILEIVARLQLHTTAEHVDQILRAIQGPSYDPKCGVTLEAFQAAFCLLDPVRFVYSTRFVYSK